MNTTLKAKDLAIMGVMAAIAYLSQVVLSFLPNIELVTLLFILYTLVIGKKFLVLYMPLFFWKASLTALDYGGSITFMYGQFFV